MKYYVEDNLCNFNFWSGGKDRAELLSIEQLDQVESMLEECEPEEGWTDTAINDFFWFEFDTICEWLGYANEEYLKADIKKEEVDEAQEWAEETSTDYNSLFAIAGLKIEDYESTNEDGETECDWDLATEDFMEWWNCMDDIEQVKEYRKYQ